jgi:hypothetical protein
MDQLMEDVLILSRNTRVKHRLVNLAAVNRPGFSGVLVT